MAAEAAQNVEALNAQAQRLIATFTRAGYEQVAPSVIQPAGLFLDVVGEELRARTYVFTDPEGEELCLRPDLTVPTCRLHLARHPGGRVEARYCYNGPAFRYQAGSTDSAHPREFRQAGIESFAAADREQDDAAVLALIAEALRETGLERFQLSLGDLGLFDALLDALPMPRRWRRRLHHHFWRPEAFHAELVRLTSRAALQPQGVPRDLIDRLDPEKPEEALALVAEHMDRAGLELIGTRTLEEIAARVLAEAADAREPPLEPQTAALIESYVAVRAPARDTARRLEELLGPHGIDLGAALDAYRRRLDLLEGAGRVDVGRHVLRRVRPQPRVLHGLRVRDQRAEAGPAQPGGGRRALRQPRLRCRRALARAGGRLVDPHRAAAGGAERGRAGGVRRCAMSDKLVLALPSKGRLMEQCAEMLAKAGLVVVRSGSARGYKAEIKGLSGVEVNFVSSAEIAQHIKNGTAHLGITGEDLLRETIADCDERVAFLRGCGFGHADVVVAVPDCWIDVRHMADLEEMAASFRRLHGRRVLVATKYMNLTRRFFSGRGVTGYRIVESFGATEGAPAAGLAELIVDITTTGSTLRANGLRILDDGLILRSEANLVSSKVAQWTPGLRAIERDVVARLAG